MSDAWIIARGLRKRFGAHTVLDALDLDVARGERVAILGPSGSGKSTLLRVLMGLERPDAGTVTIGGDALWATLADARTQAAARRRLGFVFQHFNLFPHLTALDNVALAPRRVGGLSTDEARRVAREHLAQVGLADRAGHWPAQLSGGQRQRVAIARALAMRPEAMLFDEPTSALDPELVGEVLGVIRRLAATEGMTMLVVTHQIGFAREIADRVVFMDGGVVVEQGPPDRVLDAPQQERTRAFLGAVLSARSAG